MDIELLRSLVETWGPPGKESRIRGVIAKQLEGVVDETRVDRMGNLIALKRATHKPAGGVAPLRVMLSAHMDEIGFIAAYVDEKGFIRIAGVGGLRPASLPGNRVVFEDGTVGTVQMDKGILAAESLPKMTDLFVDVGAADRDSCPIKVGDMGAPQGTLVAQGDRLIAKSMDDRVGCAVAIEALRQLKRTPHDIYAVFSVQEEVGIRGARTSAYAIDPDIGIALDVTGTGDFPEAMPMAVSLGKGAAIKVQDSSVIPDPRLRALMVQRAREARIPYQLEVLVAGGTDTAAIQATRAGVPAGCISIPCRYIHTISEMIDARDAQACADLLTAILEKPIDLGE
jgi:endoglucanase